jgi:hypothetical protein
MPMQQPDLFQTAKSPGGNRGFSTTKEKRSNVNLPETSAARKAAKGRFAVQFRILPDGGVQTVVGQEARTLRALVAAGSAGITSLDIATWALRTSHYIFKLRGYGLVIEMERENHAGPVPGLHGRYHLRSRVELIEPESKVA